MGDKNITTAMPALKTGSIHFSKAEIISFF